MIDLKLVALILHLVQFIFLVVAFLVLLKLKRELDD